MPAKSLLMLALFLAIPTSIDAQTDPLLQLLQHKHCARCNLNDADLVHADLRDVDLNEAQLKRANLSQAKLDGADLSGSDLSFSSLQGASLRGADLRGSVLYGTDLPSADLSGAKLDLHALEAANSRHKKKSQAILFTTKTKGSSTSIRTEPGKDSGRKEGCSPSSKAGLT